MTSDRPQRDDTLVDFVLPDFDPPIVLMDIDLLDPALEDDEVVVGSYPP